MARKNTLIHLHGSSKLTKAELLNPGEIAVTHAPTKVDTELVVKTTTEEGEELVYIPSLNKVTKVANDAVALEAGLREAADVELSARIAAFEGTGTTSVTGKIEALKNELQGQIDAKVDTEDYDTKMGELDAEDVRIAGLVTAETAAREADKAELDGKITAETAARESAITALTKTVGTKVAQSDYDKKMGELDAEDVRIAGLVTAETAAREADKAELAGKITAETAARESAITALTETVGTKVAQSVYDEKMGKLDAEDLRIVGLVTAETAAREADKVELEAAMIKDATVTNGVEKSVENNILSLDFSSMTIDCGTYDAE